MKKIIISGQIGFDVTADKIRAQMNNANGDNLDIQIASPGGFVAEGLEIYNLFSDYKREHPETQMNLSLKGVVASIASYLASHPAFDIVKAEDNSVFMIHNPYAITVGDYRDMRKSMDTLLGLTKILSSSYANRSKKSSDEIKSIMDAETSYFGDEIKAVGFADEMITTGDEKNKIAALANAKMKFENLLDKMKDSEKSKNEMLKIAAFIKPMDSLQVVSKNVSHAKSLIQSGNVDKTSGWSFSSEDGNSMLGANGDDWNNYSLWHLAEDTSAFEKTKERYKYPYGKGGKVYRSGVIAAKQRAAQQDDTNIANSADSLLQLIDKAKDEVPDFESIKNFISEEIKKGISELTQSKSSVDNGDNKIHTEVKMDINELKKSHPEIYAEVLRAGRDEELQRIKNVKAQSMPGHDALIESLILDGKTTGAEAAVAVIKAENDLKAKALSELGTQKPVPSATATIPVGKQTDPDAPIETRAKAEWDKSKEIRAEFGNYDDYLAFRKNEEAGNVKILGGVK